MAVNRVKGSPPETLPWSLRSSDEHESAELERNLVFGLPAEGLARRCWRQTEQHAAVESQGAWPDVVDRSEKLRPDAVILLADRSKMAERPRLAVGLKARLDHPTGGDARLPGIAKGHPAIGGERTDLAR